MFRCDLCHFATPLDDVVVLRGQGGCLCLGCYARETETVHRMPKALRKALIAALAELDAV